MSDNTPNPDQDFLIKLMPKPHLVAVSPADVEKIYANIQVNHYAWCTLPASQRWERLTHSDHKLIHKALKNTPAIARGIPTENGFIQYSLVQRIQALYPQMLVTAKNDRKRLKLIRDQRTAQEAEATTKRAARVREEELYGTRELEETGCTDEGDTEFDMVYREGCKTRLLLEAFRDKLIELLGPEGVQKIEDSI